MVPATSCPDSKHLQGLLDGSLPVDQQTDLARHLDTCPGCQQMLETLAVGSKALVGQARGLSQEEPAPESALHRAIEELKEAPGVTQASGDTTPNHDLSLDFLSPAARPGQLGTLGHYEVLQVIGRGGMGIVLKAVDPSLNRFVAVKALAPQLATSAAARKRFAREARAAAAVSHEHVVSIHAVEEANGLPYLVMEYVAGVSLQERVDRTGPLELKQILRIGTQTARGLAAAHAQGLIHRDIKPANILLENGVERVKITDFGLARAVDDASLTQSGVIAGTPQYMAPEQAQGEAVDPRADLFSLGSVLYTLCTGRPPFRAGTTMAVLKRVCEDMPRPVREINPDVPDWLADIVEKLHAKDPADRFQSAAAVAELLSQHLAHLQQPAVVPMPPRLERRAFSRPPARFGIRRWAMAAGVVLAVLGGLSEATGITRIAGTVIRIWRPEGTLVVEVDDPGIQVTIDGEEVRITGTGQHEIRLRPGQYHWQAIRDGKTLGGNLVTVTRGGKQVVRVGLEANAATMDEQKLQGIWTAVSGEVEGRPLPAEAVKQMSLVFDGEKAGFDGPGGTKGRGTFSLDPGKDPKRMTIIADKTGNYRGMQGIYRLEGDRLTVCMGDPQVERPGQFRSKAGVPSLLLVNLERARTQAALPRKFAATDKLITQDDVTPDQGGWRIETKASRTVGLFEVANPGVEDCRVIYRASLKSADLKGRAYLEMWCRFGDRGEFFSRGLMNPVSGTTDWAARETPFFLKKGEKPDLIKLNLVVEGKGTVWIKDVELLANHQHAETPSVLPRRFMATDKLLTQEGVTPDQDGWRIEAKVSRTVGLFEVANPGVEDCRVIYRARLKAADLKGRAYLEMWCRFGGQGEFFSRGLMNPVSGSTDWASHEAPFFLKKGEKPDLIKLNLVVEGKGTVWIKDVELLANHQHTETPSVLPRRFMATDKPLTREGVTPDQDGWRIEAKEDRRVSLFEVANPGVDECRLVYRARLKSADLKGRAYLDMSISGPEGRLVLHEPYDPVSGTSAWTSHETPLVLKRGEKPDLIRLNLVIEGTGTVWVKNVELLHVAME